MRLLACLIVAPQRGYDEPAILSYAISSFCPTSADGLQGMYRSAASVGTARIAPNIIVRMPSRALRVLRIVLSVRCSRPVVWLKVSQIDDAGNKAAFHRLSLLMKTIGIVLVACMATSAELLPPVAA